MSAPFSEAQQPLSPAAVDAASRWPLLGLLVAAAGWLLAGLLLAVWAHWKLLDPEALGGAAWTTYGRLAPMAQQVLFYGFASQAGLGLGLWLLARLGGVALQQRWLTFLGGAMWNLGVFLGVVGIGAGDGTGYPLFGAPLYGSGVMWAGLAAMGISAWHTLQGRVRQVVYPSQGWVMAGIFWCFWLMSVGVVLLHCVPPRGVMQVVVSTWLANNMLMLWLTAAGLAVVFYFVPRWTGRPLHSVALSKTVFWVVAVFGTASGFHFGLPVPRWLPAVSAGCDLVTLVAVLALALNLHHTVGGGYRGVRQQPGLMLVVFGAWMWMTALAWQALVSRPGLQEVVNLTHLTAARPQLWLFAFALPVFAAGLGYVLPRLTGGKAWDACPLKWWMAGLLMGGVLLWMVGMLWAGNAQAAALVDWHLPFLASLTASLPGLKLAAVGLLAIGAGGGLVAATVLYQGCGALWRVLLGSGCPAPASVAEEVAA